MNKSPCKGLSLAASFCQNTKQDEVMIISYQIASSLKQASILKAHLTQHEAKFFLRALESIQDFEKFWYDPGGFSVEVFEELYANKDYGDELSSALLATQRVRELIMEYLTFILPRDLKLNQQSKVSWFEKIKNISRMISKRNIESNACVNLNNDYKDYLDENNMRERFNFDDMYYPYDLIKELMDVNCEEGDDGTLSSSLDEASCDSDLPVPEDGTTIGIRYLLAVVTKEAPKEKVSSIRDFLIQMRPTKIEWVERDIENIITEFKELTDELSYVSKYPRDSGSHAEKKHLFSINSITKKLKDLDRNNKQQVSEDLRVLIKKYINESLGKLSEKDALIIEKKITILLKKISDVFIDNVQKEIKSEVTPRVSPDEPAASSETISSTKLRYTLMKSFLKDINFLERPSISQDSNNITVRDPVTMSAFFEKSTAKTKEFKENIRFVSKALLSEECQPERLPRIIFFPELEFVNSGFPDLYPDPEVKFAECTGEDLWNRDGVFMKSIFRDINELRVIDSLYNKIIDYQATEGENDPNTGCNSESYNTVPFELKPLVYSPSDGFINGYTATLLMEKVVALILCHVGFDMSFQSVLCTFTDIAIRKLCSIGKTMRLYVDERFRVWSKEDIILRALNDHTLSPKQLEDYIYYSIRKYGAKLTETKLKLERIYNELICGVQETPKDGCSFDNNIDQIISGNFFREYNIDTLNLKEVGLDIIGIPNSLWQGNNPEVDN